MVVGATGLGVARFVDGVLLLMRISFFMLVQADARMRSGCTDCRTERFFMIPALTTSALKSTAMI